MPKVTKGAKYREVYNEQVQEAADAVRNGMSWKQASKNFGVPRTTLKFRQSETFTKEKPAPAPVLGYDGEKNIVNWIKECHLKGFPVRNEDIQASVKKFLDQSKLKNPFHNNIPGNGWYKSFLIRNSAISERQPEGVTAASSCVSEQDLRNWFT